MEKLLNNFEKQLYEWIKISRYRIVTFLVLVLVTVLLSLVPYINLFIETELIVYFVIVLAIMIFHISFRKIIFCILILLFLSMALYMLREIDVAELLMNYIFGIFLIGIVLNIFRLQKEDSDKQ